MRKGYTLACLLLLCTASPGRTAPFTFSPTPYRLVGTLQLETQFDNSRTTRGDGSVFKGSRRQFTEEIDLLSAWYVYHPNFFLFDFDANLGFEQKRERFNDELNSPRRGIIEEYDFYGTFFPKHPYNLVVFAEQEAPVLTKWYLIRDGGLPYEKRTRRGGKLLYRKKPWRSTATYTSLGFHGHGTVKNEQMTGEAAYHGHDFETAGHFRHDNIHRWPASVDVEGVARNDYGWGRFALQKKRWRFDTRFSGGDYVDHYQHRRRQNSEIENHLEADLPYHLTFEANHDRRRETEISDFDQVGVIRDAGGRDVLRSLEAESETDVQDMDAELRHQLYESLTTSLFADRLDRLSTGNDNVYSHHGLNMDYTKKVRPLDGLLEASLGKRLGAESTDVRDPLAFVEQGLTLINPDNPSRGTDAELRTVFIPQSAVDVGSIVVLVRYQNSAVGRCVSEYIPLPTAMYRVIAEQGRLGVELRGRDIADWAKVNLPSNSCGEPFPPLEDTTAYPLGVRLEYTVIPYDISSDAFAWDVRTRLWKDFLSLYFNSRRTRQELEDGLFTTGDLAESDMRYGWGGSLHWSLFRVGLDLTRYNIGSRRDVVTDTPAGPVHDELHRLSTEKKRTGWAEVEYARELTAKAHFRGWARGAQETRWGRMVTDLSRPDYHASIYNAILECVVDAWLGKMTFKWTGDSTDGAEEDSGTPGVAPSYFEERDYRFSFDWYRFVPLLDLTLSLTAEYENEYENDSNRDLEFFERSDSKVIYAPSTQDLSRRVLSEERTDIRLQARKRFPERHLESIWSVRWREDLGSGNEGETLGTRTWEYRLNLLWRYGLTSIDFDGEYTRKKIYGSRSGEGGEERQDVLETTLTLRRMLPNLF
ncbi:MAG: hypothetical protein AB1568_08670 [Thermodesulfobacteriota bacterium]